LSQFAVALPEKTAGDAHTVAIADGLIERMGFFARLYRLIQFPV